MFPGIRGPGVYSCSSPHAFLRLSPPFATGFFPPSSLHLAPPPIWAHFTNGALPSSQSLACPFSAIFIVFCGQLVPAIFAKISPAYALDADVTICLPSCSPPGLFLPFKADHGGPAPFPLSVGHVGPAPPRRPPFPLHHASLPQCPLSASHEWCCVSPIVSTILGAPPLSMFLLRTVLFGSPYHSSLILASPLPLAGAKAQSARGVCETRMHSQLSKAR